MAQLGDEGNAVAPAHGLADKGRKETLEVDVRLKTRLGAAAHGELLGVGVDVVAVESLVPQIYQRQIRLVGQRVIGGHDDADRLGKQLVPDEIGAPQGTHGDGQINLPVFQRLGQQIGRILLKAEAHVRPVQKKIPHAVQQPVGLLRGVGRADAQTAAAPRQIFVQLRLHVAHGVEQPLRVFEHHLSLLIEPDVPPLPVEELRAQILFQPGDDLGQGGLGHVQLFRRLRDMLCFGNL